MNGIQGTLSRISDSGNGMRMKCNFIAHDDGDDDNDDRTGLDRTLSTPISRMPLESPKSCFMLLILFVSCFVFFVLCHSKK